ncbi:MAG: tetratricopeptide repeat protein [Candidatus Binatia bacterium]
MTEVQFCPQCGAKTVPQANFCAACGVALPGRQSTPNRPATIPSPVSTRTLLPGLFVFTFYLLTGLGIWLFVLRTQPFPTAAPAGVGGQASTGGSALPQDHPEIALPEEAKKILADLVDKANAAPQDLQAWKTLAEAQARAARLDSSYRSAALSSYRHVLELAPNDLDALRGVGNVYYDFEEFGKAIEYYQRYLALRPDDASVRTDIGTMYLYSNNIDRAITEYQTVIAKKPDFFQAYFNLGIAYQEKGDTARARQLLVKAKSLTTEKAIQERIEQVLTQFSGDGSAVAPSSATVPSPPGPQVNASLSPFQQAVEHVFRSHDIMGPRISRIEWPAAAQARVLFQNFPISGMPPEVRERFLAKLRLQISDAKSANKIGDAITIELIDISTNQVMETLTMAAS